MVIHRFVESDFLKNNIEYFSIYIKEFGQADHEKTVEILKKKYPQWIIKIIGI